MRHHTAAIYCAAATICVASTGAAHISLDAPVSRYYLASSAQADQNKSKAGPCGASGDKRTTNTTLITTFKPGETITVTWRETIQHPGHFRIAFDSDGQDFAFPGATSPGGVTILADDIADKSSTNYSQQVTLPNIECSNCTLQLVQIMTTDPPPYAATGDLYFNCADLVLKASTGGGTSAGGSGGTSVGGSGVATALGGSTAASGGNSPRGGTGSAGTSVGMAKGGNPGSGGISAGGGARSVGGAAITGGVTAIGGALGSGSNQANGGSLGIGGTSSVGSTSSNSGTSSVGSTSSVGGTATNATLYGSGGNASSVAAVGGVNSTGGAASAIGGTVAEISGAAEDASRDAGCGCRIAARSRSWTGIGLLGLAMLIFRRGRRRSRSRCGARDRSSLS